MRLFLALIFILTFSLSCKDDLPSGPHEIYYGEDVCERCKMIISEEQFSSQYVLKDGEVRKFDDLGCMLHYISHGEPGEKEKSEITNYYVKDYSSGDWIDGGSAYYVSSEDIKTPMGYGVVAFKNQNSIRELPNQNNAKVLGGFDEAALYMKDK